MDEARQLEWLRWSCRMVMFVGQSEFYLLRKHMSFQIKRLLSNWFPITQWQTQPDSKSPDDRRNVPMAWGAPLECTTSDIVSALRSFKPGSAAGPDGLGPRHIQDMVQESDSLLISALVFFIITCSQGVCLSLSVMFFWSKFACIAQKGWRSVPHGRGFDPSASNIPNCKSLGIGADVTPAGTKTTGGRSIRRSWGQATRAFLLSSSPRQAVVKLDFINAFNTVRCDSMLETVAQDLPELFNYVSTSYASTSSLKFGDYILSSEEGVQ